MTVVAHSDDFGLSLGPIEAARISLIGLLTVWLQVFVVETNTIGLNLGDVGFRIPASMVIDLPVAFAVALTVRQTDVAPWFGFALGLLVDSYHPTVFGLHAGLFCLAAAIGPRFVGLAPGVRTLATGAASIGAVLVAARMAILTLVAGGLPHSPIAVAASLIGSTLLVVILTFPLAGVLDRRSRPLRYLNRSVFAARASSRQTMRSVFAGRRRR